jgi:hypothetical protein
MRRLSCVALLLGSVLLPATSSAEVPVVFGQSWDGPQYSLQSLVDAYYGPGVVQSSSYIGTHLGDIDPWFWVDKNFAALLIREVAGNSNLNVVGWYIENGTKPVIDGINDGVVFDGPAGSGASAVIMLPAQKTKFGFYMNPAGRFDATNAPEPEAFFTNRFYNDVGPNGSGALHAPTNGDVQALVFDISTPMRPNTWLVAFEDLDSGANPGLPGQSQTDNDYNDFLFEVTALGATPVKPASFGELKVLYLK